MTEAYDNALLGILQNEGKVAPFLDVMLGFLYRRTDYFRIMKTDHDSLGFPPGVAKKLLMNIFSKYETLAQKEAAKMEEMKKVNENEKNKTESKPCSQNAPTQPSHKEESTVKHAHKPEDKASLSNETNLKVTDKTEEDAETKEDTNSSPVAVDSEHDKPKDGEEQETEEQIRQRRLLQSNPLTYNGAERENYLWSQNISEIDLRVKVPKSIVKGKQVRVTISKKHVCVSHQDETGSWATVVDADLVWEIDTEECVWTITAGEFVHINLEKREERWWECVFVDEPKINTRKIDCSRPMTDLDDEAQAKIEEMMYNQRQKQLGLPQSHEQKTHEMLRKAWDAEGSPFKGQPFDPSKLNMDSNGIINMNQS